MRRSGRAATRLLPPSILLVRSCIANVGLLPGTAQILPPHAPRTDEPGLVAALDSRLTDDRSPLLHLGAQVRAQALGRRADHDNPEILETRAGGGHVKRVERIGARFPEDVRRRLGGRNG